MHSDKNISLSLGPYYMYIMIGTRPDIFFAVTKMAQFSANPSPKHTVAQKTVPMFGHFV